MKRLRIFFASLDRLITSDGFIMLICALTQFLCGFSIALLLLSQ